VWDAATGPTPLRRGGATPGREGRHVLMLALPVLSFPRTPPPPPRPTAPTRPPHQLTQDEPHALEAAQALPSTPDAFCARQDGPPMAIKRDIPPDRIKRAPAAAGRKLFFARLASAKFVN